jgi:general secretion pathway protein A
MYNEFYGFRENPFNITADPEFFFSSVHHAEAFSHLVFGIKQRKGILVITGEIGTGKTTLCRMLLNRLDDKTKTALILNPDFSDIQLIQLIVKDLGIGGKLSNKNDLISALNQFLLDETTKGNNVVLIIDEAQNLGVKQLEQVRLLSNLETEKEKLLQIILVGQPELADKLKLPELRQLNQRVTVRFHILPLDETEVADYITHRLSFASSNGSQGVEFTPKAMELIYRYSQGTPRMINILCDRALLAGFIGESRLIDDLLVEKCAREIL